MKTIFFILFVSISISLFAQKTNEKLIYSFKTKKGKIMSLTLDTVNNVMIYRYGKNGKTELEKRDTLYDDNDVFSYSYYFRGGAGNMGLDLNYVSFKNKDFTYKIYDEYSAYEDSRSVGILLKNTKTGKKYKIIGLPKSVRGDLSVIRDEEYIPAEEANDEE